MTCATPPSLAPDALAHMRAQLELAKSQRSGEGFPSLPSLHMPVCALLSRVRGAMCGRHMRAASVVVLCFALAGTVPTAGRSPMSCPLISPNGCVLPPALSPQRGDPVVRLHADQHIAWRCVYHVAPPHLRRPLLQLPVLCVVAPRFCARVCPVLCAGGPRCVRKTCSRSHAASMQKQVAA